MAKQDPWDLQVQMEREVFLVCLVFLDPKATEASLVLMAPKAASVLLVKREKKGLLDLLVPMDQWDLLDPEANEEGKVHPVLLD